MQVWSLGRVDPLEKGMATHSSILAWRILWTEPGGMQVQYFMASSDEIYSKSALNFLCCNLHIFVGPQVFEEWGEEHVMFYNLIL